MTPLENLHYAIGELAYAVARADGQIQKEEKRTFLDIINKELSQAEGYEKTGEIIFKLMEKREETFDPQSTYDLAMQTIRMNGHYLSPQLKSDFIRLLERIAEAYPPVTREENIILKKFREDIEPIHGDPVYYSVH